MNPRHQLFSVVFGAIAAAALVVSAHATLTAVGPFTGTNSESFESFLNFKSGPDSSNFYYQPNGLSIMGGFATMSAFSPVQDADMLIYSPSNGAGFGLNAANSYAQVADGVNGLGTEFGFGTLTINFNSPITAFGGYFASSFGNGFTGSLLFTFSDGSTGTNGSYSDTTGALVWEGWSSSVGLTSVTISGKGLIVMDGLQVITSDNANGGSSVPDTTSTLAMLSLSILGLVALRRRFVG